MNSMAIAASPTVAQNAAQAIHAPADFYSPARRREQLADRALRAAATFWFVAAAAGQLLFACYVAVFYGRAAARGEPELWNKVLQPGYVQGDNVGNFVVALHLLFAVAITAGGVLQLVPAIRRNWPRLHRWNGRVYVLAAVATSIAGLYMIWVRNGGGDLSTHIAISLSALLIMGFAGMAWRRALGRQFDAHRRWALRLFLVVNGSWIFRVSLMFWIVVNRGPVGFDPKTFTGPFITFLSFAEYLVPLAILELYFRVQQRRTTAGRFVLAGALLLLTLAMTGGIAAAAALIWLPHMR